MSNNLDYEISLAIIILAALWLSAPAIRWAWHRLAVAIADYDMRAVDQAWATIPRDPFYDSPAVPDAQWSEFVNAHEDGAK